MRVKIPQNRRASAVCQMIRITRSSIDADLACATFSTIATRWEISFSAGFDATKLRVELMQLSVCYCQGYPPIAHHYQPYKLLPFFTHVDTCRWPFFSSGRRSVRRRAGRAASLCCLAGSIDGRSVFSP